MGFTDSTDTEGKANEKMYGGNLNAFDSKVNTNVPQGTSGVMPESNPDFSTGPSSSHVTEGKPVRSSDVDVSIGDKNTGGTTFSSNQDQRAGTSHLDPGHPINPDRADAGKKDYSPVDKLLSKIPGVHPSGGA